MANSPVHLVRLGDQRLSDNGASAEFLEAPRNESRSI
jgi:hypothetical protein